MDAITTAKLATINEILHGDVSPPARSTTDPVIINEPKIAGQNGSTGWTIQRVGDWIDFNPTDDSSGKRDRIALHADYIPALVVHLLTMHSAIAYGLDGNAAQVVAKDAVRFARKTAQNYGAVPQTPPG